MFRNYTKIRNNYKLLTIRKYSYLRNFPNDCYQTRGKMISILSILAIISGYEMFNYNYQHIHNETMNLNKDSNKMIINVNELMLHNKPNDCWVSINGHVYDVTDFIDLHPGGADKLLKFAGKDATKGFRMQHNEGYLDRFLGEEKYRGELHVPEKPRTKNKQENKNRNQNVKEKLIREKVNNKEEIDEYSGNVQVIKIKGKIIKIIKSNADDDTKLRYQDIINKYDKYYKKGNKENIVKIKLI